MTVLRLGDVIDVGDADYRYGIGRLILRVTTIGVQRATAAGDWLDLDGLELRPDGTQLGAQPRHACIRVTALRNQHGYTALGPPRLLPDRLPVWATWRPPSLTDVLQQAPRLP